MDRPPHDFSRWTLPGLFQLHKVLGAAWGPFGQVPAPSFLSFHKAYDFFDVIVFVGALSANSRGWRSKTSQPSPSFFSSNLSLPDYRVDYRVESSLTFCYSSVLPDRSQTSSDHRGLIGV
jgi:hypothetical protein